MNREFVEKLKELRTSQSLKQDEMAERLKLGLRQYQRIESGEKYPSVEQILDMNKELKHDFFSHFVNEKSLGENHLLSLNIEQTAATRVILRALSELIGSQQGRSITGVTADLNRVLKDEIEDLKLHLLGGGS